MFYEVIVRWVLRVNIVIFYFLVWELVFICFRWRLDYFFKEFKWLVLVLFFKWFRNMFKLGNRIYDFYLLV